MVKKKGQSNRKSLKQKYKIEKKVKVHQSKLRKEARRNPKPLFKTKDIGIPNSWPFKESLLRQIEKTKERNAAEKERLKEDRKLRRAKSRENGHDELLDLMQEAEDKTDGYDGKMAEEGDDVTLGTVDVKSLGVQSRKTYMRELHKVIHRADVVLEVLDARDPAGSRSMDIEHKIRALGKRLVLVLNKIDLVPKDVLEKWIVYLRRFAPVIAIKASTQEKQSNIGRSGKGRGNKASDDQLETTKTAVGIDSIMQLLKNYTRNFNIKTSITVACVGYPNVGKSSLINSLKRTRAVSVSAMAGHTKVMAEVNLDSKIKMLDSPGVVFDPSDTDGMVLRNCINVEDLEDPSQAVQSIVDRCRPVQLMQLYNVPAFTDVSQFLGHVARRTGKLGKGGVPDKISTAKNIVNDWNQGKIQYFTSPPKDEVVEAAEGFETQLVTEWGSDFDITKVQDLETIQPAGVDGGDTGMDTSDSAAPITMELAPRFPAPVARDIFAENSEDDDSDDDDEEETAPQPVVAETKAKGALNKRKRKEMDSLASLLEGSMAVKKGDGAKEDSNDMEGSDGEGSSSVVAKKEPSKKKKKKSRRRAAERNDTSSAATTPKEETASSSANAGSASKKKKVATKAKASADSFDFDAVFQ